MINLPELKTGHPVCSQSDVTHNNGSLSASTANFKGHQLQATQVARRVVAGLQGTCSICLDDLAGPGLLKLSLLPCFHIFHCEPCLSDAIKEQRSCPECRAPVDHTEIKVYENSTALEATLPLECTENLCTALADKVTINSGAMAQCPYPLATFPHQKADNFLEKNSSAIIDWLCKSFHEKRYSTSEVRYKADFNTTGRKHIGHKPAITLTVQFGQCHEPRYLYYSSVDINNAQSPEAAFKNLLEDLRTDLLFIHLQQTHSAIFDKSTSLYIDWYDLWDNNAIFIKGRENHIPLRAVFDPATKSFSWDRLKQELEKKGFEYRELFDTSRVTPKSFYRDCVDLPGHESGDDHDYSSDESSEEEYLPNRDNEEGGFFPQARGRMSSPSLTEERSMASTSVTAPPSGEMDTNEFMF